MTEGRNRVRERKKWAQKWLREVGLSIRKAWFNSGEWQKIKFEKIVVNSLNGRSKDVAEDHTIFGLKFFHWYAQT
jgi:hypothetical protein